MDRAMAAADTGVHVGVDTDLSSDGCSIDVTGRKSP